MASTTTSAMIDPLPIPALACDRGGNPYRLSVRQYLGMIEAGLFDRRGQVELLGGVLVAPMTKGTSHDYTLGSLCIQLRALIPAGNLLREDKSLQLGPRSRPEPDVAIVVGPLTRYRHQDPSARETSLIVEVAESSYPDDRGKKWQRYAAAKIPIYWIVNLRKRQVEVYRDPVGTKAAAVYGTAEIYGEDAGVPVVIDGVEVGWIIVREIMP